MIKIKWFTFCILILLASNLLAVGAVQAQTSDDEDPAMFIIAKEALYSGSSGWYAGYVVAGQSGTYTLNISATGSQRLFPVSNVKIIAVISDQAQAGGLSSLAINGVPITTFTAGIPAYYGANGGPFSEPDYYGYNDQYVIPQLTYQQTHFPDQWYQITVTVDFASTATEKAKVMFLCYGIDSHGNPAKAPFSQVTLFVLPEYVTPILGVAACFGAYIVFQKGKEFAKKRKREASGFGGA